MLGQVPTGKFLRSQGLCSRQGVGRRQDSAREGNADGESIINTMASHRMHPAPGHFTDNRRALQLLPPHTSGSAKKSNFR